MLQLNFQPFPELQSERLYFRALNDSDIDAFFSLRSNPERMKYIPRPLLSHKEEAKAMIDMINEKVSQNTDINWAICDKKNDQFIGIIGFYRTQPEHYRTEIGYMIGAEFEGKAYTTEAIKTMLAFAFHQLNFHSVEAVIDPQNIASEKLLQKNGFLKEAHFRENEFFDGKFWDAVHYAILQKDFRG
jgi:[ribosomal protein S5]-alanine N-acetyltransferase